ncbi:CoA transferase subunit A [Brevundimonas sp.]|uniref:CoA transferase subunit A n=1 Tax=Brevundimonas sp. TaxID=1871086 RepID=UPI003D6CA15D
MDKRETIEAALARLSDGMTIGIGGWATRRKPMALVRAIAQSNLKDLTVVSFGGPDVGLLAAAGKLRKLVFAFVSLDQYPLDPHFRAAREAGLPVFELDEGLLHWGLRAAAMKLPFLPSRVGAGTDLLRQDGFGTVKSPFADGETLVAMPAIKLDAALLHVHRADARGNTVTLSADPFFDELMARAADTVIVSSERIVDTAALDIAAQGPRNLFERALVTSVVEAPFGAHPTSASPDYPLDLEHLKTYIEAAGSPEAWTGYRSGYVDLDPAAYLAAVGGAARVSALPAVVY